MEIKEEDYIMDEDGEVRAGEVGEKKLEMWSHLRSL